MWSLPLPTQTLSTSGYLQTLLVVVRWPVQVLAWVAMHEAPNDSALGTCVLLWFVARQV